MTVAKDTPRPSNQHRLSTPSLASSLPARNSYSRTHSHTSAVGSGSYNPAHRVTRRKSTTLNAATSAAAITAAINIDANGEIEGSRNRRSISSRAALNSLNKGSYPSPPSSLPQHQSGSSYAGKGSSAPADSDKASAKARGRRASEASTLTKKKSVSAAGDLKCETCGKGYKHSSCLTKHLWEHTPEWQLTSKLLISKHQQVQLLEAASVLMAMNVDPPAAGDGAKISDSDNSSASPEASGFDSREDEPSSAETTPPPHNEPSSFSHRKTYSNASSFSRSYQSNYSENPSRHARQWSVSSSRPPTAQTSVAMSFPDDDRDQDMAAAMGLLNCASSYKSPRSGPSAMASNIPPVPELPPQYRGMSGASYQPSSLSKTVPSRYQEDIDMVEESSEEDDDRDSRRIDEADEGVFGKMEE